MEYSDFNIIVKTGRTTGEYKTTCPICSHTRKKKTDKCLAVNLDKKVWKCWNGGCGWTGGLFEEKREIVYVKPSFRNNTNLSDKLIKWFESRGISQPTLIKMKIGEGLEWMPQTEKEENTVQFNYFEGETLVNTKFRTGAKHFKLVKDAEKIPYNINGITDSKEIIIVEGEIDVLSFIEAGITNVISVPNGATEKINNLDYLNRFYELFIDKTIIISTDNDNAGRSLLNSLADRFGRSRCFWVDWGEFKDANECLVKLGINGIIEKLAHKKEFEIIGSTGIEEHIDDVYDVYDNGLDEGQRLFDGNIDEHLRFAKGYITTITGIPGHGKSEFIDHIATHLIIYGNQKGAFYSPENKPTKLHISKIIRKLSGKGWFGNDKLNRAQLGWYLNYLIDRIWFIKPPKGFTLDNILESVKELKLRKNIDFFVIDAWNKLEHIDDSTTYVGKCYDKLEMFCQEHGLHCFMAAHPTKMQKDKQTGVYEVPNLYSISGSANFFNKTDNGISVYRRFDPSDPDKSHTEVHIQKVKFNHWGKIGAVEYDFDKVSLRYIKRYSVQRNNPMVNFYSEQQEIEILQEPKQSAIQPNINFEPVNYYEPTKHEEDDDEPPF